MVPTCRGKLLMEGEGEVKGDKGMESRKYTKTSARFPQHARAEPGGCTDQQKWVLFPVLCSKHSQSQLLSHPPLLLSRLFPFPWTYFTPFTAWIRQGCSNTTCFLRPPLGSRIRPLPPRLFSLLLLIRPLLYLFTAGCLFFY